MTQMSNWAAEEDRAAAEAQAEEQEQASVPAGLDLRILRRARGNA